MNRSMKIAGVVLSGIFSFVYIIFSLFFLAIIVFAVGILLLTGYDQNKRLKIYKEETMRVDYYHNHYQELETIARFMMRNPSIKKLEYRFLTDDTSTNYYELNTMFRIYSDADITKVEQKRFLKNAVYRNIKDLKLLEVSNKSEGVEVVFADFDDEKITFTRCFDSCVDQSSKTREDVLLDYQWKTSYYKK